MLNRFRLSEMAGVRIGMVLQSKVLSGQESEIILQQGTKFRVTKVEKTPGMIYIDLEVIEQSPQR